MTQIAKTLVFLCVLIGAQAVPHHDVISGNKPMKDAGVIERLRRDVMPADTTPPVCRAVNVSTSCLSTCGNSSLEVTYVMTDINGSGLDYVTVYSTGLPSYSNITQSNGVDENGHPAILWSYSGICCAEDVEATVIDKDGNMGRCPVVIRRVTTTSGGSITTTSLWLSLIVMALTSTLI